MVYKDILLLVRYSVRSLAVTAISEKLLLSKLWETGEDRGAWQAAVHRVVKSRT